MTTSAPRGVAGARSYAAGRLLGSFEPAREASPAPSDPSAAVSPRVAASASLPSILAASPPASPSRARAGVRELRLPPAPHSPPAPPAQAPVARCAACGSAQAAAAPRRRRWRKVLYEPQDGYEDNYVDDTFLSCVETDDARGRRKLRLDRIFQDTTVITQQVSVLTILLVVYGLLLGGRMGVRVLIALDLVLLAVGAVLMTTLDRSHHLSLSLSALSLHQLRERGASVVKRGALFVGGLLALSPVLRTLTAAYSSDTIWALAIVLSAVHLATHDYGFVNGSSAEFRGTVSLNAAVFSSVLLASRLGDDTRVFAFILYAFLTFAGFPLLAQHVKRYSLQWHNASTVLLCAAAYGSLVWAGGILGTVYLAAVFTIAFVCPVWLKWVQRYKEDLRGPWDYNEKEEGLG